MPPPPPPPPVVGGGAPVVAPPKLSKSAAKDRGALLSDINKFKGAKLKKVQTNDRSAPVFDSKLLNVYPVKNKRLTVTIQSDGNNKNKYICLGGTP